MNDFREQIYACTCERCRAIVRLVNGGAVLQFSPTKAGRLCELAVVAATGATGMAAAEVVRARREYARHLGIELSGAISDSNNPVHILHAVTNSNHNPQARNRINIGNAHASLERGVFRLV